MPKVFLMLFLLLIAYSAEGQLSISGSVKNKEGEALTGATVSFKDSFKGTVTGANGKFIFTNLSSRQYTILVSYVGYSVVSKNIFLEKNMDIDIILEKSPYGLEEVVVKSSRAGLKDPVAMHMIDKEEITSRNLGQDIPSLLSHSPSLVSSSDAGHGIGYSGFRIRGTDANRINITIDGIPLNDAESHGVWWVNLPDFASSVEDIQIQRGVGTSTNGSAAFGASVNLKTAALSSEPYAESDNSFGSFSTWKTSNRVGTGLMENGFSFDFRYSMIGTDGFIDRAESSLNSMFITAGYYSEKNILKFNLISGTEKTYQAWDGVPSYILPTNRSYNGIGAYTNAAGMEMYYDNETDNYSQDHLQLHYTRELTEGMWLNASLHYTLGEGYYEQYKSDEKFNDYGIPDLILGTDTISSTDLIRQKWLDNDFYGTVLSLNYQRNILEANTLRKTILF